MYNKTSVRTRGSKTSKDAQQQKGQSRLYSRGKKCNVVNLSHVQDDITKTQRKEDIRRLNDMKGT